MISTGAQHLKRATVYVVLQQNSRVAIFEFLSMENISGFHLFLSVLVVVFSFSETHSLPGGGGNAPERHLLSVSKTPKTKKKKTEHAQLVHFRSACGRNDDRAVSALKAFMFLFTALARHRHLLLFIADLRSRGLFRTHLSALRAHPCASSSM